jgi:hypothetical protein
VEAGRERRPVEGAALVSAPKEHQWSKFWWQDYERDPALRSCSLAAQGLWMRMLCFMHEGDPYGYLTVNGKVPDNKRLAAMIGKTEKEITACLHELDDAGVFSRDGDGTIYSRRLVRDKAVTDEARENGRRGGNPSLKPKPNGPLNPQGNPGGLTPPFSGGVKLQEAKKQKQEAEAKKEPPPRPPPVTGEGRRRRGEPRFSNGFAQIAHELANGGSLDWLPPEDADGTPH